VLVPEEAVFMPNDDLAYLRSSADIRVHPRYNPLAPPLSK
jgi:hypothetical protein